MDHEKVSGTFVLDGLLQGELPADEDITGGLQAWVAQRAKEGMKFDLGIDGRRFTILPDDRPCDATPLMPGTVPEGLEDRFGHLLEIFPVASRLRLSSTLRSVDYRPSTEVQTLYAVVPPGRIEAATRELDAETIAPAPTLSRGAAVKMGCLGLAAFALLSVLAITFLDLGFLKDKTDTFVPLKIEDVVIEEGVMKGLLRVEKVDYKWARGLLTLKVSRGVDYAGASGSVSPGGLAWSEFYRASAVKRGRVRVEFFDADGDYLASSVMRIGGLAVAEEMEVLLQLPPKKVALIHLTAE